MALRSTLPAPCEAECVSSGHTDSDLPNGLHMNGVTMNGAPGSDSDQDSDSDEFGQEPLPEGVSGPQGGVPSMEHRHKQASGAPEPLEPELVTLSLLPRSQWQSLVHLDAIKVGGVAFSGLSCHVSGEVGCCGG